VVIIAYWEDKRFWVAQEIEILELMDVILVQAYIHALRTTLVVFKITLHFNHKKRELKFARPNMASRII